MNSSNLKYSPVHMDYFEMIENEIIKNNEAKVHYFVKNAELGIVKDKINKIITINKFEKYLLFYNGSKVRIDRIVTLNGIPGPAFDEYDSYALACLECMAGMDDSCEEC